jgi:hypothetical protein
MTTDTAETYGTVDNAPADDEGRSITNPFIAEVLRAMAEKGVAGRAARRAMIEHGGGDEPLRAPRKLQHFVGFIHVLPDGCTWRIYTCLELDQGVDLLADEVLYRRRLDPSPQDGLSRDVVVVADGADAIYWSRRELRAANREPGGGNGIPYPEG